MANFFSFFRKNIIPSKENISKIKSSPLSIYGLGFYVLSISILIVFYIFIIKINNFFVVSIPSKGGTIVEGVIGAPRFINPLLAKTETDMGLAKLIYSGLTKEDIDGQIAPDLALGYVVSPDGLVYTFNLKKNLHFSDGSPLTTKDIIFTFQKLSSSILNNKTSAYWQSVSIETSDEDTVSFRLPAPDINFLSSLTLGILPFSIWGDIKDEDFENQKANISPIGSGPFKYSSIVYEKNIPKEINLKRNNKNKTDVPYLDGLDIVFFSNQNDLTEALENKDIDMSIFISPQDIKRFSAKNFDVEKVNSDKSVAIYHLQKDKIFSNQRFVSIVDQYLDKKSIIDKVDGSYGTLSSLSGTPTSVEQTLLYFKDMGYQVKDDILQKNSIPVSFGVAIENSEDMLLVSKELATQLGKLGIHVTIKAFDHGIFQDNINSSQYDIFLAKSDNDSMPSNYEKIISFYTESIPLIKIKNIVTPIPPYIKNSTTHYLESTKWYTETDQIWKFLKNKQ